ncbi:homeobox protein cut-like isoform X2 [Artemia franciscana]|uniref:homeobox protein cut-like isoform X2 n=1 Tax=Artemia franciscana TaxID=6661 RepID=UPI0032DA6237
MAVIHAQRDLSFEEVKESGFLGSMAQTQDSNSTEGNGQQSFDILLQERLRRDEGTNMAPRPTGSPASGLTVRDFSKDLPNSGQSQWPFLHNLASSGFQPGQFSSLYPGFYGGSPFPPSLGGMLTEEVLRAFKRSIETSTANELTKSSDSLPDMKIRSEKNDEKDVGTWTEKQEWQEKPNILPWLDERLPPLGEGISSLLVKSNPLEARLHEMLHRTMDRYAHQPLDTLAISRAVRELLSQHNIGQRLFAKWVLGLSQGTVSELLSKPKPWDKLTEKGRDSYRKMHAWACDGGAVRLLKALLPRKGKDGMQVGSPEEEATKEERIAHILSEAQAVLRVQSSNSQVQHHQNEDSNRSEDVTKSPEPQKRSPSPVDNGVKWPEKPETEEEAKPSNEKGQNKDRRSATSDKRNELRTESYPGVSLEGYKKELAQFLNQQHEAYDEGGVQDLSLPRKQDEEKHMARKEIKKEMSSTPSPSFSQRMSGILQPGLSPLSEDMLDASSIASPLQRIASITNSLMSQPPPPVMSQSSQRPMKAVLPPITQQQFDAYQTLNTEDIVKKVKEVLSQYSISQRLFGEAVLGLSQGSVSDLLARPKPWHMLTQKGREPFIRMKLFLDDDTAIHRLVASQYKVAPERLMRTAGFTTVPQSVGKFPQRPPTSSPSTRPLPASSLRNRWGESIPLPLGFPFGMPPSYPSHIPPQFLPVVNRDLSLRRESTPIKEESGRSSSTPGCPPDVGFEPSLPSQNIYEIAALTPDLDTQLVTSRVKEVLLANNIGQKLFGEAVLGLSQGSVSELLSKPKPWTMLSVKGREPFVRMHLWLSDQRNVQRLQQIKTERRDLSRRRLRDGVNDGDPPNSADDSYGSEVSDEESKDRKLKLSHEQKEALQMAFNIDPYSSQGSLDTLSKELNLPSRSVMNWFSTQKLKQMQEESVLTQGTAFNPFPQPTPDFEALRYRMLLSQRLFELQNQHDLPKTPVITPFQTPFYGASYSPEMLYMLYNMQSTAPGLDLRTGSHKPESPSRGSEGDCHSDISAPGSPVESRKDTPVVKGEGSCSGSSRRKRKSTAPQWVNPAYLKEGEDSDSDETRKKIKEENESSSSDITINCVVKREPQDLALTKDENYNTEKPVLRDDLGLSEAVKKGNDEL